MPLKVIRRSDRAGAPTISGFVKFPDGSKLRVRTRAQSNDRRLAEEEATLLEARLLRVGWHGEKRGSRSFAEAIESYLLSAPRSAGDEARLKRIMVALGDVSLAAVDQAAINRIRAKILARDASPATVTRGIITPIRAAMRHAHRLGWCDTPTFEIPRRPPGRTNYLLPDEAARLTDAASPHVKPLLIFLLGTGARMSEAIELEWRDVDLKGARAIFWKTKTGTRRVAALPPVVVATLAALPHRDRPGRVFRWETVQPKDPKKAPPRRNDYVDRGRQSGGHIRTAWRGAIRRAGLSSELTPHDLRHTWASWHYAIHRDLLALKVEGGWSSVTLVERYAHLLPAGQEDEIRALWVGRDTQVTPAA